MRDRTIDAAFTNEFSWHQSVSFVGVSVIFEESLERTVYTKLFSIFLNGII